MKAIILKSLLMIGLFSLGSAAWSAADGVEETIAALERQWIESQQTNNPDLIAPHLADGFITTWPDGKVRDKAGNLADEKAQKYTRVEEIESKVMVFGDTAIAMGLTKAKGIDASGKPFESAWRYTDTWVKMPNGKWLCVASHASDVAMWDM